MFCDTKLTRIHVSRIIFGIYCLYVDIKGIFDYVILTSAYYRLLECL